MKIAFDAQPLSGKRTGIGNYTLQLIRALAVKHPDEEYYGIINSFRKRPIFPEGLLPGYIRLLYTRVPNIIPGHLSAGLRYGFLIGRECRRAGIGLFHGTDFTLPLNFKGKKIVTVHDLSFLVHPEFFTDRILAQLKNTGRSLEAADVILSDSKSTARDIAKYFPSAGVKVKTVYPGLNEFFLEQDTGPFRGYAGAAGRYILYSGTIEPRKNLNNLISAFEQTAEKTSFSLIIAGKKGWMCDNVFRHIENSKFRNRIIYAGYVDDATLRGLYRNAEMFVYPSFYEGFGFPVIEAQASGIPVITSPGSSLAEVGADSVLYADPLSPGDLADKILMLSGNPELKKSLISAGFLNIRRFSWGKTAEQVMDVYLKCFKKP